MRPSTRSMGFKPMLSFVGRHALGRDRNVEFIGCDGTKHIRFSLGFLTMEKVFPSFNEGQDALTVFAHNENAIHAAAEIAHAAGRFILAAKV